MPTIAIYLPNHSNELTCQRIKWKYTFQSFPKDKALCELHAFNTRRPWERAAFITAKPENIVKLPSCKVCVDSEDGVFIIQANEDLGYEVLDAKLSRGSTHSLNTPLQYVKCHTGIHHNYQHQFRKHYFVICADKAILIDR